MPYIDVETPNYIRIYDSNINYSTIATYLNNVSQDPQGTLAGNIDYQSIRATGTAITAGNFTVPSYTPTDTYINTAVYSGAPYYTPMAAGAGTLISNGTGYRPLYQIGIDYGTRENTGDSLFYNTGGLNYVCYPTEEQTAESRRQLKQLELKSRLIIQVKSRANSPSVIKDNERVAMETLRETVTEEEYRRYLKYGFIMVKGKSGDEYQIFRNKSHTRVWRNGQVVEEICVRIRDSGIPPTDNVIAFRAMAMIDEHEFKKSGNVYKMKAA
jgi:hypothetical protein